MALWIRPPRVEREAESPLSPSSMPLRTNRIAMAYRRSQKSLIWSPTSGFTGRASLPCADSSAGNGGIHWCRSKIGAWFPSVGRNGSGWEEERASAISPNLPNFRRRTSLFHISRKSCSVRINGRGRFLSAGVDDAATGGAI